MEHGIVKSPVDIANIRITSMLTEAHRAYNSGLYLEALGYCESLYEIDAFRTDNLLLLGAIHFQLRHFSESIFYNQQCLNVDPGFAESYSNLGNSLRELGDLKAAAQFYQKVQPSVYSVMPYVMSSVCQPKLTFTVCMNGIIYHDITGNTVETQLLRCIQQSRVNIYATWEDRGSD
jgi:Tetratricopeptide repeat